MSLILVTAAIALLTAVGLLLIFHVTPRAVLRELRNRPPSFREQLLTVQGRKKRNFFQLQFDETRQILESTGRAALYGRIRLLCGLLAFTGVALGLLVRNPFLSVVLAVGGLLGPLFWVQSTANRFRSEGRAELYSAISIVTSSYERLGDFAAAVQENMGQFGAPMDAVFREFLRQCQVVDPSVSRALLSVRGMLHDSYWAEWCDAVQLCLNDPRKKKTLREIVEQCGTRNREQDELDSTLRRPMRDVLLVMGMTVLPIPMLCLLFHQFVPILLNTLQGKLTLSLIAGAVLFSTYKAVHATRPLKTEKGAAI